jgi:hypothetical protein
LAYGAYAGLEFLGFGDGFPIFVAQDVEVVGGVAGGDGGVAFQGDRIAVDGEGDYAAAHFACFFEIEAGAWG